MACHLKNYCLFLLHRVICRPPKESALHRFFSFNLLIHPVSLSLFRIWRHNPKCRGGWEEKKLLRVDLWVVHGWCGGPCLAMTFHTISFLCVLVLSVCIEANCLQNRKSHNFGFILWFFFGLWLCSPKSLSYWNWKGVKLLVNPSTHRKSCNFYICERPLIFCNYMLLVFRWNTMFKS